jgi:hypothetical protein
VVASVRNRCGADLVFPATELLPLPSMSNLAAIVRYGPGLMIGLLALLSGCTSMPEGSKLKGTNFQPSSLAKTDVDLITETIQGFVFSSLKELATKLYKRNPREWRKTGYDSVESAVRRIVASPFSEVEGKRSIACIQLAFDGAYAGDRVKALVIGLETMTLDAYGGDQEFYMFDQLDAQKLYYSARNIEVASWMLRAKRNSEGELFLLSSTDPEGNTVNPSFERLFGKMINAQDIIAQIAADSTHRTIKQILQKMVTAFIPII